MDTSPPRLVSGPELVGTHSARVAATAYRIVEGLKVVGFFRDRVVPAAAFAAHARLELARLAEAPQRIASIRGKGGWPLRKMMVAGLAEVSFLANLPVGCDALLRVGRLTAPLLLVSTQGQCLRHESGHPQPPATERQRLPGNARNGIARAPVGAEAVVMSTGFAMWTGSSTAC